jgi:hypothetical protein
MARRGVCFNVGEYEKALFSTDHDFDANDDGDSDGSGPEPDDWDEDLQFGPGDSLGKALALVKQVSFSPIPLHFLHKPIYISRYVCRLRRERFLSRHAIRSASSRLNFFSGFVHGGRHYISLLIGS